MSTGGDERPLRRDVLVVLGLVGLLALPHLVRGPQLTADDWVWVRNGEYLGWWDAGGSRQVGRPGAYVLYAIIFGLGGAHPLVHALVQVGLWAGAAVAVLLALRELVQHRLALLIVGVWLVSPTHTTLELWASTSQAWIAIACLALGSRSVVRAARGAAALWPGLVLLGLAGAFYEVAIVAAPVCALLADRVGSARWRHGPVLRAAVACLPALAWSLHSATVYTDEVRTTERFWIEHLAGSLSMGAPLDNGTQAALVVLVAVVVGYLALRGPWTARSTVADRGLVVAGAALVAAGTLPALRAYTLPFGMGNRLLAVSGVGAAAFWVGALRPVGARLGRPAATVLALVLLVVAGSQRLDHMRRWRAVGDEGVAVATGFVTRLDATGDRLLVHRGPVAVDGPFYGIYDGWNATAATQVVADDPTLVVQIDVQCLRSGPLADEPLEQYGRRPEARIDGCTDADDDG